MTSILNFDKTPEYLGTSESGNASYRQCLRDFFIMNLPTDIPTDIDDESQDELLYDTFAVKSGLEFIYQQTKEDARFIVLYQLSAGQMLSEDREIGLAVLFSYDYFQPFFHCLKTFFLSPDDWSNQCES